MTGGPDQGRSDVSPRGALTVRFGGGRGANWWWKRLALCCLVCGAIPAAALARPAGKRGADSALLTVTSYHWVVSIEGQTRVEPAGGTVEYCPGANIESVTPTVRMKASKKGVHIYGFELDGPKGAGGTGMSERSFSGHSAALTTHFLPVALYKMTASQDTPHFIPGLYRFKLVTFTGRHLSTPRPTFAASLKLRRNGAC